MKQTYSQKVNDWLVVKSGCTLIDFCRKFGYKGDYIKMLSFDPSDEKPNKAAIIESPFLKTFYCKAYKSKPFLKRCGEGRTVTHYCQDLIAGWVMEDLTIEMFKSQGIEVFHNGKDFTRTIEIEGAVTQDADCMMKVGDSVRKVELSNEFNNIMQEQGFAEKRMPALHQLWKDKGIWLYRELNSGRYILVDFATEEVVLHLRHHNTSAQWGKDVHRYFLEENGKKIREDRLLAPELISLVGCSIDGREQPQLKEIVDEDSPPQIWWTCGRFKDDMEKENDTRAKEDKPPSPTTPVKPIQEKKPVAKPKTKPKPTPPPPPPPTPAIDPDLELEEQQNLIMAQGSMDEDDEGSIVDYTIMEPDMGEFL